MTDLVRWPLWRFHRMGKLDRLERLAEDGVLALEGSLDLRRGDRWVLFVDNDEELAPAVLSSGFVTDLDGVLAAFGAVAGEREGVG